MTRFAQANCLFYIYIFFFSFIYKTTVFIWVEGEGLVCFSGSVTQCRNYSMEWWTLSRGLLFCLWLHKVRMYLVRMCSQAAPLQTCARKHRFMNSIFSSLTSASFRSHT